MHIVGEDCLVSTLSSKAKKETEVQSPGCNIQESRCTFQICFWEVAGSEDLAFATLPTTSP